MTKTEQYIELFRCAVNNLPPKITEEVDLQDLWDFAQRHSICATLSSSLLASGYITDENWYLKWREAKYKNIRKTYLFDAERASIYRALSDCGVPCAPLKGVIINRLYPVYGTREFADNDLLLRGGTADTVSEALAALGYARKDVHAKIHYTFHKPPMFNFELHFRLFPKGKEKLKSLDRFFDSITSKMIPPAQPEDAWSLSNEDNYLYLLAHAYKHYLESGVGLRTLSDVFLFRSKVPLDEGSVARSVKEMRIEEFVQALEGLANKIFLSDTVFSRSMLNASENALLEEILEMGTFGNWESYYHHRYHEFVDKSGSKSLLLYYKSRLFPDMEQYKSTHPVFYQHKALRPFFYVYRPIRGLLNDKKRLKSEWKAVSRRKGKHNKENSDD